MKHPFHKLGKKNRNIISGIMVAIASLFLIAMYLDVPASSLFRLFGITVVLVIGIIILAIITIAIFKGIRYLIAGPD